MTGREALRSQKADEAIGLSNARYNRIMEQKGFEAARDVCIDDLMGAIFWLDRAAGTGAAHALLQVCADQLLQPPLLKPDGE